LKKNNFTLVIFLIIGLIAATIVSGLLAGVPALSFLTKSAQIVWQPKADLQIIQYDLNLHIRLNLISIIGLAAAFWIYRKL
jgi:hypothetical protein